MAGNLQNQGWPGLVFGPIVIEYGPKGSTSHFTVTSAQIAPLITYYNYIIAYGASGNFHGLDVGLDGVTSAFEKKLEVSVPGLVNNLGNVINELLFDQWELLTNESTDTVFNNPLITQQSSTTSTLGGPVLNYNDKMVISRMKSGNLTSAAAIAELNADASSGAVVPPTVGAGAFGGGVASGSSVLFQAVGANSYTDGYGGNAPKQLQLEVTQKDQLEYEKPTYVLRHTSYCSALATYNTSLAYTECIYTPAQLLSEVGSGWTYNLPPRLYSKISAIPQQYPALAESPYYRWGWLKKITREPVLSNFIVEVSTEYVLDLWSNLRYGLR